MKSLIRKPRKDNVQGDSERKSKRKADAKKVAQCCAKVSRSVAGCHD